MPKAGLNKEILVAKAAELANRDGLKNLSLRSLADYVGVKPPSLYKHIDGLDALYHDIMIYGWNLLEKYIYDEVIGKSGDDAVRGMCDAYYNFAMQNPGVFESMQTFNQYESEENKSAMHDLFQITAKIFSVYHLSKEQMLHLVRTFRGFLQGFMMLTIQDSFGSPVGIKESFDLSVDILIKGIACISDANTANET